jgi:hypothetical protein
MELQTTTWLTWEAGCGDELSQMHGAIARIGQVIALHARQNQKADLNRACSPPLIREYGYKAG